MHARKSLVLFEVLMCMIDMGMFTCHGSKTSLYALTMYTGVDISRACRQTRWCWHAHLE